MSEIRFGNGWIIKAPYVQNSQGFRLRRVPDLDSFQQKEQLRRHSQRPTLHMLPSLNTLSCNESLIRQRAKPSFFTMVKLSISSVRPTKDYLETQEEHFSMMVYPESTSLLIPM
eukprot:gene32604-43560_t